MATSKKTPPIEKTATEARQGERSNRIIKILGASMVLGLLAAILLSYFFKF
ncbi:MAG: hypothetical protein K0U74_17495 [Alphaproteobacteria bacterium]|nr:hypothetical protein [Alphaproteobacteria bacterium]